jgi:hypothetical protein
MKEEKNKNSRPEAYPKPTVTDTQLQNQPEYIDQQPNSFEEDISSIPVNEERKQDSRRDATEDI